MNTIKKLKKLSLQFIDSWLFPIFVAFFILVGHTFSIEIVSMSIIAFSVVIGLLFCKDIRFLISPALMIVFIVSSKSFACWNGEFINKSFFVGITVIASIIGIAIIARFVIFRKSINLKLAVKSPIFWGLLVFSLSILLGGIFNKSIYSSMLFGSNLVFSIAVSFSFIGIFLLFYTGINFSVDFRKHLIFTLFIASMLVTLEFYIMLFSGQIELAKESIVTGWGIWNNIGAILTVLLPVHFYCFAYGGKFRFTFLFTAILTYATIVLTFSRASLLGASLLLILCLFLSCFVGKNKLLCKIAIISLCVIILALAIVFWNKLIDKLNTFFDDNGRFELYKAGIDKFLQHPILGSGFMDSHSIVGTPDHRYHNTIIQILASCGIIGMLAYGYHRFETIKLIVQKKSGRNLFLSFCLIGLLFTSLFDIHFFNIYPAFYYTLILIAIEKSN